MSDRDDVLRELLTTLREYLALPSTDGATVRQALREDLREKLRSLAGDAS